MDSFITPLVTGAFAIIGAFLGASLARVTEYQKWLRQNQSETFSEFLARLDDTRLKAQDVLHDPELSKEENHIKRDIQVTDLYLRVENYSRIVRLYLPKRRRNEFSDLVHAVYVQHSSVKLGDGRMKRVDEDTDQIQAILEETLERSKGICG